MMKRIYRWCLQGFRSTKGNTVTKVKDITFASISTNASTKVRTTISDPSSGVTIDVVQKMLAERDAFWVDWMNKKDPQVLSKRPAHLLLVIYICLLHCYNSGFCEALEKCIWGVHKKKMPLLMPSINRGVRFLLTEAVTKTASENRLTEAVTLYMSASVNTSIFWGVCVIHVLLSK